MPKGNCQFKGTGGQYFATVFIHGFILSVLTLGIYGPWAWVRILKLKASHTTMNGKSVTFAGNGGQLLVLLLIQGIITLVTLGIYAPWAICRYYQWRLEKTLVGGKPSRFTGTGGSLFIFYLIHLMILPMITLGIYYLFGMYRFYAWKEEHAKYGGEKTTFGASFLGFLKVSVVSYILNLITFNLFFPWAICMFSKWQMNGIAVGNRDEVEHFPPVKTNLVAVLIMVIIGLIPFLALGFFIKSQYDQISQMTRMTKIEQMRKKMSVKRRIRKTLLRPGKKTAVKAVPKTGTPPKSSPGKGAEYTPELNRLSNLLKRDKNADLYYNRGLIYARMKKYKKAIDDFNRSLELKPREVDAYCNRGNAYFQSGKADSAIKDYSAALKISPDDGDIYYNRAIVYLSIKEKKKAAGDFQKAAELGNNNARKYLKMPVSKPKKSIPQNKNSSISSSTGWTMDLNNLKIPASVASGQIHGEPFMVEKAEIQQGVLTIRQGKDFFPDRALTIFLFLKKGDKLEGKIYNITSDKGFGSPHIHMKWREEGKNVPETKIFMKDYVMRLEFGKKEGGEIPGKIYIALPDEFKSFVAGRFVGKIKKS